MTPIHSDVDTPARCTSARAWCVPALAQLADGDCGYEPACSGTRSATSARRTR